MTAETPLDAAADAIADEVGLDTSYFVPTDQRDFDPITIGTAVGLVLLGGFLDGIRKGLHDQAEAAGTGLVNGLAGAFTRLFKQGREPSRTEVEAAASRAREAVTAAGGERLSAAAELTELALVRYFLDLGMPDADARRLALRVRTEGMAQVQPPAAR
jgi:hypothetical protein